MKTPGEIQARIDHIKTLGKGWGVNDKRIKELEWVLKVTKPKKTKIYPCDEHGFRIEEDKPSKIHPIEGLNKTKK